MYKSLQSVTKARIVTARISLSFPSICNVLYRPTQPHITNPIYLLRSICGVSRVVCWFMALIQ